MVQNMPQTAQNTKKLNFSHNFWDRKLTSYDIVDLPRDQKFIEQIFLFGPRFFGYGPKRAQNGPKQQIISKQVKLLNK